MQLSPFTRKNLEVIKSSNLSDENFNKLVTDCFSLIINDKYNEKKDLLIKTSNAEIKPEIIKAAYIDITTIIVEAARHGYDANNLSQYLSSAEIFPQSKIEKLCDVYSENLNAIKNELLSVGDCYPCIKDVTWRLDFCIKTSENNVQSESVYHISLITKKHGVISNVFFTCTIYQLQDLVYKLKDIVRHLEKLSGQ